MTEENSRQLKSYVVIYALLLIIMVILISITFHFQSIPAMWILCSVYGMISSILIASKVSKWIG